jgi:hypothetical protein
MGRAAQDEALLLVQIQFLWKLTWFARPDCSSFKNWHGLCSRGLSVNKTLLPTTLILTGVLS